MRYIKILFPLMFTMISFIVRTNIPLLIIGIIGIFVAVKGLAEFPREKRYRSEVTIWYDEE